MQHTGYVWLVQSEPGNPRHPPERLAELFRARLRACTGIMGLMREQIRDPQQVVYRPLESLLLPQPWYRGRIVLIGDAAHATTPHLGQGSAQAVEDAVVLGELMRQNSSWRSCYRSSCSGASNAAASSSRARCSSANGNSTRCPRPIR